MKKIILLFTALLLTGITGAQIKFDDIVRNPERYSKGSNPIIMVNPDKESAVYEWKTGEIGTNYSKCWIDYSGKIIEEGGSNPKIYKNIRIGYQHSAERYSLIIPGYNRWERYEFKFLKWDNVNDVPHFYYYGYKVNRSGKEYGEVWVLITRHVNLKKYTENFGKSSSDAPDRDYPIIIGSPSPINFVTGKDTILDMKIIFTVKN